MSWIVENTLVAGCASFALVLLFRRVEVRPAIRHGLWLLVLVKLVLPPLALPGWPPAAWHSSFVAVARRFVAQPADDRFGASHPGFAILEESLDSASKRAGARPWSGA